ncbi:TnsA endonuclease N-terminal domain-containing protein [Colwellia psychrerythraea]|uniref:TnsA endonuclease n=1 Tax=Colwellia psychrerythraea TaxID=28229 RepID=A0A099KAJ7_COLPS|nr:TnsA endonuclease N-terminal domain-containing protein [Colwellia psychrerythraea]KGJ87325.1 TnsA endonuclease [Colwellia psychrerythraea]
MSKVKRRTEVTVNKETVTKLNKWKKDLLEKYRPYLTVRDVNQIGRRHWLFCPIQKRHVHLLSDGEYRTYKKILSSKSVVKIEEQYALDIDETLDIAIALNAIHPRDWETNLGYVMTTDFVVTYMNKSGSTYRVAYTFKYWEQIYEEVDGKVNKIKPRTWQKFDIERQYWKARGVDYRVLTERDATKAEAWNFDYFELAYDFKASKSELTEFAIGFVEAWLSAPHKWLQDHFKTLAGKTGKSFQHIQSLFQYMGLHNLLPINCDKHIRLFRPVELEL